ncbi:unnamed protein product [Prorocentrum cordatum]|uniref:Uncharacterized protein n=1 Tax=Prorocentrum cordatum TaxID=2364126 RepID=A0ABN9SN80_9DINO|nr:unnamed protein product [Polarella glacialis]
MDFANAATSGGSRGRPVAAPALLLSAAAALVVALAAGPQEEVAAGKGPDFFGLLFNLKEEERDIRKSEEVIQKDR